MNTKMLAKLMGMSEKDYLKFIETTKTKVEHLAALGKIKGAGHTEPVEIRSYRNDYKPENKSLTFSYRTYINQFSAAI